VRVIWCSLVVCFMVTFCVADERALLPKGKELHAGDIENQKKFLDAKARRAEELSNRRARGHELARQKAYNKKIAKEWEIFTQRFEIRRTVPIYSGDYLIGSKVVVSPNHEAIAAYQRELQILKWNAMTEQQRRDMALFEIAKNTGVIAQNTGATAANTRRIADGTEAIGRELRGIAWDIDGIARQEEIDRMIRREWPLP